MTFVDLELSMALAVRHRPSASGLFRVADDLPSRDCQERWIMNRATLPTALALVLGSALAAAHATTLQVRPGTSIQAAINAAQPGDTIQLASGRYLEDLKTARDGTPSQPITITGPADAVISGAGTSTRVFEINHDYIRLHGFTLDGKFAPGESKESYRDILMYVVGTKPGDGVTGLQVLNLQFRNAGGECL